MMTLYWSSRSPFVRKVMIVAHELGIAGEIDTVRTLVHAAKPNRDYMATNPMSKIPTLVVGDLVVYDSVVICEYLDATHAPGRVVPGGGAARWKALTRAALADGMMETAVGWRVEVARELEKRSEELIEASATKIASALDAIENDAGSFDADRFMIGEVATASALAYLDFRFPDQLWRDGRPRMAAWFAAVSERPSVVATAFVDQS